MEVELKFIFGRFAVYFPLGAVRSVVRVSVSFTLPPPPPSCSLHLFLILNLMSIWRCYTTAIVNHPSFVFCLIVVCCENRLSFQALQVLFFFFLQLCLSLSRRINCLPTLLSWCMLVLQSHFFVRFSLVLCSFRCTKNVSVDFYFVVFSV